MKKYLVGIVLCMLSKSILAGIILDQSFVPIETLGSSIENESIQAQSFTVGINGRLDRVDLYLHLFFANEGPLPTDGLTFNLLETDTNGIPVYASSLASVSIAASQLSTNFNSFISLDLVEFNIQVSEGDVLALSLETELDRSLDTFLPGYSWGIGSNNPYSGGNLFSSSDFGDNFFPTGQPRGTADVGFKTYVYVPEPGIFLLFGLGLIVFFLQSRHSIIQSNRGVLL